MDYLLNIYAFSLSLLLFCFWSVLGYATLSLLRSQRNCLQNLLLAPGIGLAVTLLPVFWLNRLGLPISFFATILSITLLALSLIVLLLRKPLLPMRKYLPFAGIFLLALFITGSPLLQFGFHWISYGNDDMANYCLGATRILNHGFFDIPNINILLEGTDYSEFYWFMHVPSMVRAGSETILAMVSAVTHLSPLKIFMPVIIAFHLTLISVTGALVCTSSRRRQIAIVACLLLTFSALTTLGTLYQLIAQVSGLSLFITSVILLFQPFTIHRKFYCFTQGILIAITLSAFFIFYPELIPFLAISFILYFGLSHYRGWRINKSFNLTILCAIIATIIFLNIHIIAILHFVLSQTNSAVSDFANSKFHIFPYYLLPSGIANLWGLLPMSKLPNEPLMSFTIIIGTVFGLFTIGFALRQAFLHSSAPAIIALAMLGVGIGLFYNNLGFGLFKLAMFMQPFILCVISVSLFELIRKKTLQPVIILCFVFLSLPSLGFYIIRSQGTTPGSFSEIAYASESKMNTEYLSYVTNSSKNTVLLADDFNSGLLKLLALQSEKRHFFSFISPLIYMNFYHSENVNSSSILDPIYDKLFYRNEAEKLSTQYSSQRSFLSHFNTHDANHTTIDFFPVSFCSNSSSCAENGILIADTSLRSIINRRNYDITSTHNFIFKKYNVTKNHLAFTDSAQGAAYNAVIYSPHPSITYSFYNLEKDPFYADKTMQGIGRYLLFRIVNPTPSFRMGIAITNTLDGNGLNNLPPGMAVGTQRTSFPLMGRGSARIFTSLLSPQIIDDIPYIAIDMNVVGKRFPYTRRGLMKLFGKNILIDPRSLTTFTRDISLISEEEYQKLNPPSVIKNFPQDLANIDLEYSGAYEDGWLSENSFFNLKQPTLSNNLVIQGVLPYINGKIPHSTLTILLDGKKLATQKITYGDFKISIPVTAHQIGRRKVELHFSNFQQLPNGDNRPVAALIKFIGFS